MAAKTTTPEQHAMLHNYWPNDCCLCHKDGELRAMQLRLDALEREVETLKARTAVR